MCHLRVGYKADAVQVLGNFQQELLSMNLKHVLLSSAAVIVMAGAANAADLIVDVPVDTPVAVADTGWYLSVFGGGVWASLTQADDGNQDLDFGTDMGWLLGAAVGAHVTDNLRAELELSTSSFGVVDVTIDDTPPAIGITDGSASASYLLGNLWFDIDTGSGFTPYIGGGLGAGFLSAEGDPAVGDPVDVSGWGWAYQVGAGVKIDVADNIALDLGYRWKAIVDAEVEGGGDDAVANIGSHVVQVGLTVGF
jgi:opacity protein-like surface antigen